MKSFDEIYYEDDDEAELRLGFDQVEGKLSILSTYEDDRGTPRAASTLSFSGSTAELRVGERHIDKSGKVNVGDRIIIDGDDVSIQLGGNSGRGEGTVRLNSRLGVPTVVMEAHDPGIDRDTASVTIGAARADGRLTVRRNDEVETIVADGRHGNLVLGGGNADGDLTVRDSLGNDTVRINGDNSDVVIKAQVAGELEDRIRLDGSRSDITLGSVTQPGNVVVEGGRHGSNTRIGAGSISVNGGPSEGASVTVGDHIRLDGRSGVISSFNGDIAEQFDLAPALHADVDAGTVMVLDDDGRVVPSAASYDQRIVGVVAGAGDYRPALLLDKRDDDGRVPIALIGKVYCKVDASAGAIRVGDLLTSGGVHGHAIRVTDRARAFGAVLGKALGPLESGTGLIPVLVNLQ